MKKKIDDNVVAGFSTGGHKEFAIIYDAFRDSILNNIKKIIHQEDLAEDLLQEVFIKLWKHRELFKDSQAIAAWLFRISYNLSISRLREILREKAGRAGLENYFSDHEFIRSHLDQIPNASAGRLQEAINLLPKRKKQVLELCKLQGKTYAEASSILGIALPTTKEYLVDAMKLIRRYILFKQNKILLIMFINELSVLFFY